MKYYSIRESINPSIVGIYPQVEDARYTCDVWEDQRFIDSKKFEKLDYEPITASAILRKNAKPTDLISAGIVGFSLKLLISGKLKKILKGVRNSGMQFFRAQIIRKGEILEDYWVVNMYEIDMKFIDFKCSDIFITKGVFERIEKLSLSSYEDFLNKQIEVKITGKSFRLSIDKIKIAPLANQDFFGLLNVPGGVKYVVSEDLKTHIEESNINGIEFMPIELSTNEWLQGGEREKIYGKVF